MLALCASNSASWRIASACRMTAADAVEEVWLNPAAKEIQDIGQSIRAGDVIVKVSNIASEDELKALLDAGKRSKRPCSQWPSSVSSSRSCRIPL